MGVVPVKKPKPIVDAAKMAASQKAETAPTPATKVPAYGNVVSGLSRKPKV